MSNAIVKSIVLVITIYIVKAFSYKYVTATSLCMFGKMVYSDYTKKRIMYYYQRGHRAPTISLLLLQKEGLQTSRVGVAKFIAKFNSTGSFVRKPGSGRPLKITPEMKEIVEAKMREDDETTAH